VKRVRSKLLFNSTLVVVLLSGCGDTPTDPGTEGFPELLADFDMSGTLYEPQYPLWTNGSAKLRTVRIPSGETVNTANRSEWQFPEGTVFIKEFAYEVAGGGPPLKIETRIIRVRNGGFQTATYLWNDLQTEATLLPGVGRVTVPVTDIDGNNFDHIVPNSADCQTCHGSSPSFVLGFSELQLGGTLAGTASTQLATLAQAGLLSGGMPTDPETIAGDAETSAVLGYFEGNCAHCHNANGPFDIRHSGFFADVVGRAGFGGGTLLDPNDPGGSLVYTRAVSGSMPPIGVTFSDTDFHARLRAWITDHTF
jgi:hypothetical protein